MREFVSQLVGYASGLFQGGDSQEPATQTEERIIYEQPELTPSTDKWRANRVEQGDRGSSRKRPVPSESPEASPKKKVDRRSEHEKRLIGDFSAPRTAQRIGVPKGFDSDEAEEFVKGRTMAHKPGTRGHRPMNTLGRSPHAARVPKPNETGFFSSYANKNEIKRPNGLRQTLESERYPTTAAPPSNRSGDGFEMSERGVGVRMSHSQNKRQRLDVVSANAVRSSSPVDLTGEDDVEVVGLNGKRLPGTVKHPKNGYVEVERPSQPFEASEFLRVAAMTSTVPTKRRRKSKDGQASSQTSFHETPTDAVNGYAGTNGESIQETLDAELKTDHGQGATGTARPEINLTRGWDEPNGPLSGVSTAHSQPLQNAVTVMDQKRGQAKAIRGSPRRTQGQQCTRRTIAQLGNKLNSNEAIERQRSPRLSERFTRDESEPDTSRTTAKQRMKATSQLAGRRVSPIKDGSDSADELAGGTTVGSQASRSVSPQKRTRPRFGSAIAGNGRKRSSSPSDLQPTQFYRRGSLSQRDDIRAGRPVDQEDSDQDMNRVRLQAFYATSCILTSGNLLMQYDQRESQFDLYCDEKLQVLRGKKQAVSIGKLEADKFFSSRGSHRVYLTGSQSDVSNGHICIAFLDSGGVQWFLDRLLEICGDHLSINAISEERLDKIFSTQIKGITTRNQQQNLKHTNNDVAAVAQRKRAEEQEEEEIKYERFETRSTAKQSAGTRLRRETQRLQSSPYFESLQPRRSSRQLKPITQLARSPSPPLIRWTKENKPQRWTHSVVYPPEGVRRVTVDFQDLERLDEGEFLNDNIISFALRQIEESMAPEHKQEVYFFNSFFYTALATRNGKASFNYDAVKRWTKNSDLLGYPYVVVPINNALHWFVAIISNLPSVSRKIVGDDVENAEGGIRIENGTVNDILLSELADAENQGNDAQANEPGGASRHPDHAPSSRTLTDGIDGQEIQAQTKAMSQLSLSQEDDKSKINGVEGEGDNATVDSPAIEVLSASIGKSTGAKKSKKRAPPPPRRYDPDQPTIIFLDSMASGHPIETRNLKDYLRAEAEAKRGMDLDTKQLQGMTAKGIPEQDNLSDCGLYLVGFVEQFAKNPRQFVTKILTRQLDKQADFAGFDPSAKRDEIRAALLKLNEDQDADHKAKKSAKKVNTTAAPQAVASSPTRAPRKSPKPAASQAPALNQNTQADGVVMSEPLEQSTDPVVDPNASFDTGEEDLEVAVPRPLAGRPRNPATTHQRANSEVQHAIISPEKAMYYHDSTVFNDGDEAGSIAEQQGLERVPKIASDEEMFDPTEEPNEYATTFRSDAAEPRSNGDLLQGLENVVENNLQELRDDPGNDVVRTNTFQPSNGKLRPVRNNKTAIKQSEVIDLESQDAEPEVPESPQEKQQAESLPRGYGRHTKF